MFDTICMIESLHRQFLDMAEKIFVAEWGGGDHNALQSVVL
jgi:hypothetical protein